MVAQGVLGGYGCASRSLAGLVDVPLLSDKLDETTARINDRLDMVLDKVSATSLESPGHYRLLGEQGQASLDKAAEHLLVKGETGLVLV